MISPSLLFSLPVLRRVLGGEAVPPRLVPDAAAQRAGRSLDGPALRPRLYSREGVLGRMKRVRHRGRGGTSKERLRKLA